MVVGVVEERLLAVQCFFPFVPSHLQIDPPPKLFKLKIKGVCIEEEEKGTV